MNYWSELLFPSPGNLSDPGIETVSAALAGRCFSAELLGKHQLLLSIMLLAKMPVDFECSQQILSNRVNLYVYGCIIF